MNAIYRPWGINPDEKFREKSPRGTHNIRDTLTISPDSTIFFTKKVETCTCVELIELETLEETPWLDV